MPSSQLSLDGSKKKSTKHKDVLRMHNYFHVEKYSKHCMYNSNEYKYNGTQTDHALPDGSTI